jgi:hypothetical protein
MRRRRGDRLTRFFAAHFVRFWHKADIRGHSTNADITRPLSKRKRNPRIRIIAMAGQQNLKILLNVASTPKNT